MAGPKYRITAKDKESGEYLTVGQVWENEYGLSLDMSLNIKGEDGWEKRPVMLVVAHPDGELEVTNETHYLDLRENTPREEKPARAPQRGAGAKRAPRTTQKRANPTQAPEETF